MLSSLFGNTNMQKILFFLLINEKCYGTQMHRLLDTPLTPLQKGLMRLEKAGVVQSFYEGKTRFYRFNPVYPLKKELEGLVRKAYELLPLHEKRVYYVPQAHFAKEPPLSFKQAQDSLLKCWSQLKAVQHLQTHAKLVSDPTLKQGKADVKVSQESPSVICFQECGVWQMENGREISFSNTWRWTLDLSSGTIALERLGQGKKPVSLFHLKPKKENLLASIDSHLCGSDAYFGQVQLGPHFLQLSWKILGPKKNDRIETSYFSSP